mmetsp:Transcript_72653/g.170316  ORF Transcript_72653/g.170316 Transcript_72653/m.170316 type:complete len:247 (-) Transcript_72653:2202-2942(-)
MSAAKGLADGEELWSHPSEAEGCEFWHVLFEELGLREVGHNPGKGNWGESRFGAVGWYPEEALGILDQSHSTPRPHGIVQEESVGHPQCSRQSDHPVPRTADAQVLRPLFAVGGMIHRALGRQLHDNEEWRARSIILHLGGLDGNNLKELQRLRGLVDHAGSDVKQPHFLINGRTSGGWREHGKGCFAAFGRPGEYSPLVLGKHLLRLAWDEESAGHPLCQGHSDNSIPTLADVSDAAWSAAERDN